MSGKDAKTLVKLALILGPKPKVILIGTDGNAFAIIRRCRYAGVKAGWSNEVWSVVREEMIVGDYDHLLGVVMRYFDVS